MFKPFVVLCLHQVEEVRSHLQQQMKEQEKLWKRKMDKLNKEHEAKIAEVFFITLGIGSVLTITLHEIINARGCISRLIIN